MIKVTPKQQLCCLHLHWSDWTSRTFETAVLLQVAVSTVTESERLLFRKLHYPGIYRCVARYGYRDRVHMGSKFVIKLLDKVSCFCASSLMHSNVPNLLSKPGKIVELWINGACAPEVCSADK